MAESLGFEPKVGYQPTHDFQSCLLLSTVLYCLFSIVAYRFLLVKQSTQNPFFPQDFHLHTIHTISLNIHRQRFSICILLVYSLVACVPKQKAITTVQTVINSSALIEPVADKKQNTIVSMMVTMLLTLMSFVSLSFIYLSLSKDVLHSLFHN